PSTIGADICSTIQVISRCGYASPSAALTGSACTTSPIELSFTISTRLMQFMSGGASGIGHLSLRLCYSGRRSPPIVEPEPLLGMSADRLLDAPIHLGHHALDVRPLVAGRLSAVDTVAGHPIPTVAVPDAVGE